MVPRVTKLDSGKSLYALLFQCSGKAGKEAVVGVLGLTGAQCTLHRDSGYVGYTERITVKLDHCRVNIAFFHSGRSRKMALTCRAVTWVEVWGSLCTDSTLPGLGSS